MRPLNIFFRRSGDLPAGRMMPEPSTSFLGAVVRKGGGISPLLLIVWTLGATGCQCCSWTEHYQDTIDHIADHQPHLERYYHPGLDLTRIGYPDWCQSPFNRWLYGDCCCRDTRQQPSYIHNPMYSPAPRDTQLAPIPEGPAIPPREDSGPETQQDEPVPTRLKGIPDSKDLEKGDRLPPLPPAQSAQQNTPPVFPAEPITP